MQGEISVSIFLLKTKYIILFILLPLILISISSPLYVRGEAITSFVGFVLFYLYGDKKNNYISRYMLVLLFQGVIIGAFFVVLGYNVFTKYIQYSMLALSGYIAFKVGYNCRLDNKYYAFIFLLFLSNILMYIPFLIKGNPQRTSIGSSYLYPLLLIFMFNLSSFKKKGRFIIVCSFFLLLLIYLLSGMRSVLGTMAITTLLVFLYNLNFKSLKKYFLFAIIIILLGTGGYFILPRSVIEAATNRVEIVNKRFSQTLFNPSGAQLDEYGEGGRSDESKVALKVFNEREIDVTKIIGFGHGFVFNYMFESKAHMHITFTAFYVRYGIIGVCFYLILFGSVIFFTIRCFFLKRSNANSIRLGLWLSALQVLMVSLIAASLISSINMCIIGMAFGYDKYLKLYTKIS